MNSFRTAANQAVTASGGQSLIAPSDIFAIGLNMANKVLDQTSIWSPQSSAGLIIFALVLVVCFALIAAFLVLALVESYIVISAGVLFMGFGGSRWTKDFAAKIIVYALSVGAKLFVLQLIVGLGQQIFNTLLQNYQANTSDLLVSVGSAIVMLALVKIIPDLIQGLINGVSIGGGGVLIGTGTGAASSAWDASWGSVKGTAGVGMVGYRAGKLASEQIQDAQASGFGSARPLSPDRRQHSACSPRHVRPESAAGITMEPGPDKWRRRSRKEPSTGKPSAWRTRLAAPGQDRYREAALQLRAVLRRAGAARQVEVVPPVSAALQGRREGPNRSQKSKCRPRRWDHEHQTTSAGSRYSGEPLSRGEARVE